MENENKKPIILQELLGELKNYIQNNWRKIKFPPPPEIIEDTPKQKSVLHEYIHEDLAQNWENYWMRISVLKLLERIKQVKTKKNL